ncbi:hypothetical protein ACEWPM_019530 [Roseovarius sp. S4756]|uniref:hypothetical protein n=1 Tax=Roseovarius maritimus TaxID=3342637 RepID=UPI00372A8147
MTSAAHLRIPDNAARIRARLEAAEARATRILEERRDLLTRMAEDLAEVELLEEERLEAWLEEVRRMVPRSGSASAALDVWDRPERLQRPENERDGHGVNYPGSRRADD